MPKAAAISYFNSHNETIIGVYSSVNAAADAFGAVVELVWDFITDNELDGETSGDASFGEFEFIAQNRPLTLRVKLHTDLELDVTPSHLP